MLKPLFDLDQTGMNAEVNSYKPGKGLVWPTLFPLKYTPRFDLKGIEGNEGIPVSADRVAFNTKAPLKTRKTVGTWSGKLGKIAISKEKGEIEINDYKDLQVISAANSLDKATAQYLVDMVYDDIKACSDGIDYKVEIDALRIGSSGKQTFPASIEGDMATADEINFNVPADNFVGAAIAWGTSATADGIKDIVAKQKAIAAKGLKKPMYAIIENSTFEKLLAQTATSKRVASVVINVAGLASTEVLSVDNVNAYMRAKGYPQFLVIDSYATIEAKDGTQTTIKPWNENIVALSPVPQLGYTYYKPVPVISDTDGLQAQGAYAKTTVYSELNPMLEVTMAEAYVQAGLINRASLVFLNTASTSWNSGN
ncbi:MAG: major capsid protein [Bacteroidia bacterium]|nr:major capsid protein [Bacteroidia bacterium]